jgi:hypothetical protein
MSPLAYSDKYKEVSWSSLIPKGWVPTVTEDQSFFDDETLHGTAVELPKTEFAPIVKALDNQKLKLPGYMIPIKFNASSVYEFLLVPYVGACIHTPPPPENQIIYVSLKKPLAVTKDFWAPVWVSGMMKSQTSMTKFATAGYHMTEAVTEVYKY